MTLPTTTSPISAAYLHHGIVKRVLLLSTVATLSQDTSCKAPLFEGPHRYELIHSFLQAAYGSIQHPFDYVSSVSPVQE